MLMLRGHEVSARPLASLQQPACPLSDSLTFNTAVTHRFTYNRGERERETTRGTWGRVATVVVGVPRRLWRREWIRCCRADGMIASWSNR